MTVRELWDQHLSHDFPARLRGRDIGGIDFVMLDADVAGCVQTFVQRRGLDIWRVSVLRNCVEHLAVVLPELSEQERDYFAHVDMMARAVLNHVSSEPTPLDYFTPPVEDARTARLRVVRRVRRILGFIALAAFIFAILNAGDRSPLQWEAVMVLMGCLFAYFIAVLASWEARRAVARRKRSQESERAT